MTKNAGITLENEVYDVIIKLIESNEFLLSKPNVRVCKKPRYYSKDRSAPIEFDISVEKYLGNPDEIQDLRPSIIAIIECKDYNTAVPVDDVEEFHAKLQQIGADNTKGRTPCFCHDIDNNRCCFWDLGCYCIFYSH